MEKEKLPKKEISTNSRRQFLKASSSFVMGIGIGSHLLYSNCFIQKNGTSAFPVSEGYLLVDTKKCQGCVSCMLACSLVNEGIEDLSLARIQIRQNSFAKWPDDISIEQCRQCSDPACVKTCIKGATNIDTEHGNVRTIDQNKCVGFMDCIESCPHTPSRTIWHVGINRARKCDLCTSAQFWDETGGTKGKQACVEICPVKAIKFTKEIPEQEGDKGYKVNLRDFTWAKLGYPKS